MNQKPTFTDYENTRAALLSDPERRARIDDARVRALAELIEYNLAELRHAVDMTQVELARRMDVTQPTISDLERGDDPHISTLRRYVEALGGRLRVIAEFDDDTAALSL